LLAAVFAIAVAASTRTERDLGTLDPSVVVIDECWAMWLITAIVPASLRAWPVAVAAFALFRLFDILKPPPLKLLARCPAGWGIVLDDLGAALYAAALLRLGLMVWPALA
jgi:phosphatidylglycerophosphatase A